MNYSNKNSSHKYKRKKHYKINYFAVIIFILVLVMFFLLLYNALKLMLGKQSDNEIKNISVSDTSSISIENAKELVSSNQTQENKSSSNNDEWNLLLVNKDNPVPDDYETKMVEFNDGYKGGFYVDERISESLSKLMKAAKDEGINLCINSAYRNTQRQKELFDKEVNKQINIGFPKEKAEMAALNSVAFPGTSEHETGLCLDFGFIGDITWEKAYGWLEKNGYKYGFILRYPQGKEKITGVKYEAWHYRYVGKEAAKEISEQGICLEEYLENKK